MNNNMGSNSGKTLMSPGKAIGGDMYKPDMEQWVSNISSFSSEYDPNSWCAKQVIGVPKVYPRYGDVAGSWAPKDINNRQFLELEFEELIYLTEINIYETYHAGGVFCIKAKSESGTWHELWKTNKVQDISQARIFTPPIEPTLYRTRHLRLDIDCSKCGTWVEIDAVMIKGKKFLSDPPPPMSVLADDLRVMVNSKEFSDVRFEIEGEIVYGHKVFLTARCDYFRAMFSQEFQSCESTSQAPIKLVDVTHCSFIALLHYLYTNTVPDSYNCVQLIEIWRVADRFSVEGLKALATFQITEKLPKDDVVSVYVEASTKLPVLEDVRTACLGYISSNMKDVSKSKSFTALPKDVMLEIVQMTAEKLTIK